MGVVDVLQFVQRFVVVLVVRNAVEFADGSSDMDGDGVGSANVEEGRCIGNCIDETTCERY